MNPVLISVPDDGFRGGANDEFLLETCRRVNLHTALVFFGTQAVVGNYGTLFGKSLYMLSLTGEEGLGYEKGKIGVLNTSSFEHAVQLLLHLFPYRIAIRFDDHTTAYG